MKQHRFIRQSKPMFLVVPALEKQWPCHLTFPLAIFLSFWFIQCLLNLTCFVRHLYAYLLLLLCLHIMQDLSNHSYTETWKAS